ncbi:lipase maturation factor 2a [Pangasianodon hypophthalmus]|uniref:lipase maturation factor 2a n=1 Tax=Pangasianodon hypophthalmus TaxID=310915 RepID=UPI002307A59B|nr:lipase maturation factor 2a [Pangasianodon hypophthalmus]
MGETRLPAHMFLWSLSAIYMFAFASLYVQIPGLYGNEGILPARWRLRVVGKSVWEQLRDTPTLLWFGPKLGLDTQHCMELLSLSGTVLSLAAMTVPALRDCRLYLILWVLYLSLYQVGQVFLYFQWDNLLLEVGFLAVLIAPMRMPWSCRSSFHDSVTFWLLRWLLFRLMFASGVVKLTSRCPTWWGLTALTYHYETQCIPTPLAWFAHQLPVWFQKLSVLATFVIEIAVPFLFFSPIRRHRLSAFYMQVLLQVLIILSGNYNFFNLLTIVLCFSLLDDEHVNFWLCRRTQQKEKNSLQAVMAWVCVAVEVGVYALLSYWTVLYFDLKVDWDKKSVSSKTAFTHYEFNSFLKAVTVPSVWIGVLSLTWEIITAMFRSACVRGVFRRLWSTMQWGVFSAAAASMFAISLVPYTYIEYEAHSNLWPGVRRAFELTDRYQLVNSYGLFRRMTGVGGRPEVIMEGSVDGSTWTEIEFMYKPGNLSRAPPVVTPHQPRLDWQMWFAALGPHTQSPWFSSLVRRLLQGKRDVIKLIQTDETQYPFIKQPPVYIRAHRYKYWFTEPKEDGSLPQRWWRRIYVEEFYPPVRLGDAVLEDTLTQHGLNIKDKSPTRRASGSWLLRMLQSVGEHVRDVPAHVLLWTLFSSAATVCLLNCLRSHTRPPTHTHSREQQQQEEEEENVKKEEEARKEAEEEEEVRQEAEEAVNEQEEEEEEEEDEHEQQEGYEEEEFIKRSDESDGEENTESEPVRKRK